MENGTGAREAEVSEGVARRAWGGLGGGGGGASGGEGAEGIQREG